MTKLTKYEKETIIPLPVRGDDTSTVSILSILLLKRRLADFAKKHPEHCRLESEGQKLACQSYVIDKGRLSIRLTHHTAMPDGKRQRENAKNHGDSWSGDCFQ